MKLRQALRVIFHAFLFARRFLKMLCSGPLLRSHRSCAIYHRIGHERSSYQQMTIAALCWLMSRHPTIYRGTVRSPEWITAIVDSTSVHQFRVRVIANECTRRLNITPTPHELHLGRETIVLRRYNQSDRLPIVEAWSYPQLVWCAIQNDTCFSTSLHRFGYGDGCCALQYADGILVELAVDHPSTIYERLRKRVKLMPDHDAKVVPRLTVHSFTVFSFSPQ